MELDDATVELVNKYDANLQRGRELGQRISECTLGTATDRLDDLKRIIVELDDVVKHSFIQTIR